MNSGIVVPEDQLPVLWPVKPGKRGDEWDMGVQRFQILSSTNSGFWVGIRATCHLKTGPTAPITYRFQLGPSVAVDGDYDVVDIRVLIPRDASKHIAPATYFGDIELSSNVLNAVTLVRFILPWSADISQS